MEGDNKRERTNFGLLMDKWAADYSHFPMRADISRWTGASRPYVSSSICSTLDRKVNPYGVVKVEMVDAIADGMSKEFPHIKFDITEIWRGPSSS